jgi:hypothetical protein
MMGGGGESDKEMAISCPADDAVSGTFHGMTKQTGLPTHQWAVTAP